MDKMGSKKIQGRKCYGHLGGKLGEMLFIRLVELEWLKQVEDRTTVYEITDKGYKGFEQLGIILD